MDQHTILPGLSAGIFWGIAQCGFFVGSIKLGLTIGTYWIAPVRLKTPFRFLFSILSFIARTGVIRLLFDLPDFIYLFIAFPMVSTGPAVISSLWGILVFKEITGRRNLMWMGLAFLTTLVGITLITLSSVLPKEE